MDRKDENEMGNFSKIYRWICAVLRQADVVLVNGKPGMVK
jgi:hypothetical protein